MGLGLWGQAFTIHWIISGSHLAKRATCNIVSRRPVGSLSRTEAGKRCSKNLTVSIVGLLLKALHNGVAPVSVFFQRQIVAKVGPSFVRFESEGRCCFFFRLSSVAAVAVPEDDLFRFSQNIEQNRCVFFFFFVRSEDHCR